MTSSDLRIGHGFDVHKFAKTFDPEKPLKLAGVKLREELSLIAHSDGDVVLHAICDALLGAVAAGDIGQHFPDSSAEFANANSAHLLSEVLDIVAKKGAGLVNCDITIVAQVPKVGKYRDKMRSRLSTLLSIDTDRINVKATTTEGMGYIGREEGIACHAVVLLNILIAGDA